MSWKKRFAPTLFIRELVTLGPFKIEKAPEMLAQGKYRCRLTLKKGGEAQLTTYEGTIGNILKAQGKSWCEAYESADINKTTGEPYINFRNAK